MSNSSWSEVGRGINQMALRKMKCTCCIAQKDGSEALPCASGAEQPPQQM